MFKRERFLLRQRNFLCMESFQVGHFAHQLTQINQRIYFIGQQNSLLFMNTSLACRCCDEQVIVRYAASCHLPP